MELKEAFEFAEGISLKMGRNTYTIHGVNLLIDAWVGRVPEPFRNVVSVVDMQTLPIEDIMRKFCVGRQHATILQWLCTRYVQDVYPELA